MAKTLKTVFFKVAGKPKANLLKADQDLVRQIIRILTNFLKTNNCNKDTFMVSVTFPLLIFGTRTTT